MASNQPQVKISQLRFSRDERLILDGIDLQFEKGKITAIMGPSGTGKTTLLQLIGGQLRPDSGEVLVDGVDIHKLSQRELTTARRKMGLLFQAGALFTHLNVFENVAFPLREHTKLPESMVRDLVLMKLEAVGLRGASKLMPSELSGGMTRRVALARAIALDPELMMYDEPFAGQDPITMGVIVKLIKQINTVFKTTSIIVSHDVPETFSIADHIYLISHGCVIGQGTPAELQESDSPEIEQFIKGLPDGAIPFHYPAKNYANDLLEHT